MSLFFVGFDSVFLVGGKEKRNKIIWAIVSLLVRFAYLRCIYLPDADCVNYGWGNLFIKMSNSAILLYHNLFNL